MVESGELTFMRRTGKFLNALWNDGIILAADAPSDAVSGEMNEAAACIDGSTTPSATAC